MLLTSENSMQGENYEHSRTGACPYTSSAWRSFGLARRMAARGAVSQRSGVIRDTWQVQSRESCSNPIQSISSPSNLESDIRSDKGFLNPIQLKYRDSRIGSQ